MLTEIELKDLFYNHLHDTALAGAVNGKISKRGRPSGSKQEDICISVLANRGGQMQQAIMLVHVYVGRIKEKGDFTEDTARLRELTKLAANALEGYNNGRVRCVAYEQHVQPVNDTYEDCIINRMTLDIVNE